MHYCSPVRLPRTWGCLKHAIVSNMQLSRDTCGCLEHSIVSNTHCPLASALIPREHQFLLVEQVAARQAARGNRKHAKKKQGGDTKHVGVGVVADGGVSNFSAVARQQDDILIGRPEPQVQKLKTKR